VTVEPGRSGRFRVTPIHLVDRRLNGALKELVELFPQGQWTVQDLRTQSRNFARKHAVDRLSFELRWSLALVVSDGPAPVGIFGARFEPNGCWIRRKAHAGARLLYVPPYVNVGPSVALPSTRGLGFYASVYRMRMELLQSVLFQYHRSEHIPLLVGVMGGSADALSRVYQLHDPASALLPRNAFSAVEWAKLGTPRTESLPAEVLARRHGLCPIGFKKSNGGPVLVSSCQTTEELIRNCLADGDHIGPKTR
jgi:hypothetical protein